LRKVKNVGKPYAGKPHVRFDEKGLASPVLYSTARPTLKSVTITNHQ
ncbi:MAG: hypothetical protein K0R75_3877, partial [Paenibacillaceae bacterium]|nr:hypothetical protein [Paenibacillaceae bacterium]